jgi:hypothetical protein
LRRPKHTRIAGNEKAVKPLKTNNPAKSQMLFS